MLRNPPFYLFSTVSLTPFIKKKHNLQEIQRFSSCISLFEIINIVRFGKSKGHPPDPKMLFGITVSVAEAAATNPIGIKTLLANGLNTFFNKGRLIFNNDLRNVPRNPPDGTIAYRCVFYSFILADKLLVQTL